MSGRVLGAHQKIDRIARKNLSKMIPDNSLFPAIDKILHFEGAKGPDAIKRKSPAHDEPWHYFNPFEDNDIQLLEYIRDHFDKLAQELSLGNPERSAFEAAWLAHAVVDGLTPAHHHPYEEELSGLRGGMDKESRNTIKSKLVIPGHTRTQKAKNNWKMWGAKGLFMTHGLFEMGVATIIMPLGFGEVTVTDDDIKKFKKVGLEGWYRQIAREIAVLDMYKVYYEKGWTPKLAWQVRHKLGPTMVHGVTIIWYMAMIEAKLIKP